MSETVFNPAEVIAGVLQVHVAQVEAAITLLEEGASVPFIARYRKEKTNYLNDTHLRYIAERLHYLKDLADRRVAILTAIRQQGLLTEALEKAINGADTKARLEDLYLPFRPKKRTKASLAIAAGLQPLAMGLLQDNPVDIDAFAQTFVGPEVPDTQAALEGARHILLDYFTEDAELTHILREHLWQTGILQSNGVTDKKDKRQKYADYLQYAEPIKKIPSHRVLALLRGRRESILHLTLLLPDKGEKALATLLAHFHIASPDSPAYNWLVETATRAWKTKLLPKLELELIARLRDSADEKAIAVFVNNLKDLLLTGPAGAEVTMGLDPGIRTGVKAVVIDATGKVLDYATVFPFAPQNEAHQALVDLAKLIAKYHVRLVAIGNGTGSRETERLITDLMHMYPDLPLTKILVSEAGASVYSASELAASELPDMDVSIRGAVSIARRLQDPLAELVKIEPKSIGVGQYQHDVNQGKLARALTGVVEDCVNAVGVDVNTASVSLLTRVAGLNEAMAAQLVAYRESNGPFSNREQLKLVPRMGEKTFQQAAGFLRILGGDNPLDASAVHPESYAVVEKILADNQVDIQTCMGNHALLQSIVVDQYASIAQGSATVKDILSELEKPGRDPRPGFKMVQFKPGVEDIAHLQEGMILEGVVSNVTHFGAFVDIGVHQDGLVHISAMTNNFIRDPHLVVKTGDIIQVRVVEVDLKRRRIGLSMKLDAEKRAEQPKKSKDQALPKAVSTAKPKAKPTAQAKKPVEAKSGIFNTAMADALAKLQKGSSA